MQHAVVYGIVVEDPQSASLVKKVLTLSVMTAVLVVATGIIQATGNTPTMPGQDNAFAENKSYMVLVSIALGLLIPACGYFGAKNRNKNLLGWFWGCNCCTAVVSFIQVIILGGAIAIVPKYGDGWTKCACDSPMTPLYNLQTGECMSIPPGTSITVNGGPPTCENVKEAFEGVGNFLYFGCAMSVFSFCLSCASCTYGKQLAESTTFTSPVLGVPAVGTVGGAPYQNFSSPNGAVYHPPTAVNANELQKQ